jgi:hypothetical protein
MFKIPVWDILASYSGDSQSFSFAWEVYDGYLEDVRFLKPLEFSIDLIAVDGGVTVHFHDLRTEIEYGWFSYEITIGNIEREFKSEIIATDPDDIHLIEHATIDLGPIIREEVIMAAHAL